MDSRQCRNQDVQDHSNPGIKTPEPTAPPARAGRKTPPGRMEVMRPEGRTTPTRRGNDRRMPRKRPRRRFSAHQSLFQAPRGDPGGVKGPPRANGGLLRALFPAGPGEIPGPPEESTDGREKTGAGPEPGGEVRPGLLTTRAHTAGGDARPGDRGRRGVVYSGKSPGIIRLPLPITPPARAHSHRHGPRSHRRQRNFPTAPGPKNQLSIYIEIFLGGAKNISKQAIKAITLLWPFSRP